MIDRAAIEDARCAAYDEAHRLLLTGYVPAREYARRLEDYDRECRRVDARYRAWIRESLKVEAVHPLSVQMARLRKPRVARPPASTSGHTGQSSTPERAAR